MKTLFVVKPDTIYSRKQSELRFHDNVIIFLYDKYGKPTCYLAYETFSGFRRGSRVGILYNVVRVLSGTQDEMNGLYTYLRKNINMDYRYDLQLRICWYRQKIELDVLDNIIFGFSGIR